MRARKSDGFPGNGASGVSVGFGRVTLGESTTGGGGDCSNGGVTVIPFALPVSCTISI